MDISSVSCLKVITRQYSTYIHLLSSSIFELEAACARETLYCSRSLEPLTHSGFQLMICLLWSLESSGCPLTSPFQWPLCTVPTFSKLKLPASSLMRPLYWRGSAIPTLSLSGACRQRQLGGRQHVHGLWPRLPGTLLIRPRVLCLANLIQSES